MTDWDGYFMTVAEAVASKSKDPSTKVGALVIDKQRLIRATGFNGLPRGVADSAERLLDRPTKLRLVVHAEMNAICAAARVGVPLDGCSLHVTLHPCLRCAILIVQVGILEVVCPALVPERWSDEMAEAERILAEAKVAVRKIGSRSAPPAQVGEAAGRP